MAIEGNNLNSVKTWLTKGYVAPLKANINPDDISVLTGETRESKAKAYAALESKKWQNNMLVLFLTYVRHLDVPDNSTRDVYVAQ